MLYKLTFLAGGIDPGETPERAAVRETEEESGAIGSLVAKLGTYHDHDSRAVTHMYLLECHKLLP